MSRPAPKGWCPGAWRPMMSGDGLVVRVRPHLGRITAAQALGLSRLSRSHGSGLIDLTSRANLQLRGVREADHPALLEGLSALGLLDGDPAIEARRNILVAPLWRDGDETARIAEALSGRLADLPDLPGKFGFAVDAGAERMLADAPADIRIERGASGGLILRADTAPGGRPVTADDAAQAAIDLAHWFARTAGAAAGRMARHLQSASLPQEAQSEQPAPAAVPLRPGPSPLGPVLGAGFGRMEAQAFGALLSACGAAALRVAPGRLLILEGGQASGAAGFITNPGDPLLGVDACPGAPFCASATVETRALARALASQSGGSLHVSGCAKGCARPRPAGITLIGREGRFDLVRDGHAWDRPELTGLDPETVLTRLGAS